MVEIKRDVDRAKLINDALNQRQIGAWERIDETYEKARTLMNDVKNVQEKHSNFETGGRKKLAKNSDTKKVSSENENWFSSWYKDNTQIETALYHILTWKIHGESSCFIGDSDSLILKPNFFKEGLEYIQSKFPFLKRFTIYGRTKSAARKTMDDLKVFKDAGLNRIHFGLESGNDQVLKFMKKGVTGADHVKGCLNAKEAGISCSVYVMPGLGGKKWSREHALDTAKVITEIEPEFVRLRSLEVFPTTILGEEQKLGNFIPASEEEVVREIKMMVENINSVCELTSDSAANLLSVWGKLPRDRNQMLKIIDDYLELSPHEKLVFSADARMRSFINQYGDYEALNPIISPFIKNGKLDFRKMDDNDLKSVIIQIRSKLMP
jgi:hypothetical protein